jgi:hypothetical protein
MSTITDENKVEGLKRKLSLARASLKRTKLPEKVRKWTTTINELTREINELLGQQPMDGKASNYRHAGLTLTVDKDEVNTNGDEEKHPDGKPAKTHNTGKVIDCLCSEWCQGTSN